MVRLMPNFTHRLYLLPIYYGSSCRRFWILFPNMYGVAAPALGATQPTLPQVFLCH